MDVGARIKELRINRGMTVNKLANLSGVSQSYLRDIELGNKHPTVDYLEYICYGLGIGLPEFFESEACSDLVKTAMRLSDEQRQKLIEFIESL